MSGPTVAIVGGGIAGLASAFALQEQASVAGCPLSCTLIESAGEWGGKIATHRVSDSLLEAGPDSFLSQKPWGIELCTKLGIADQLINTDAAHKRTYVYSRGRLRALPEGLVVIVPQKLGPFLRSGLLSWPGLARMGMDLLLPARPVPGDESIAAFFTRRLGREAFERLVEPLMAGIYAGDAHQMSLRATFPRFIELERQHGSVIRGLLAGRSAIERSGAAAGRARPAGPPRTMFVTLRNGLGDLVQTLVARIQTAGATLLTGQQVTALRARTLELGHGYALQLSDGRTVMADSVVLATPAYVTADLIRPLSGAAAGLLESIPYASTMTVSLVYSRAAVADTLSGYGFVVPRTEGSDLLAATNTSLKWPERTPGDKFAVRCYLGGMGKEGIFVLSDEEVIRRVKGELRRMTGLTADPDYVEVNRWNRAMPQYTLGHLDRMEALQRSLAPYRGLYLVGAAYRGIGIPDCIRDGTEAATAIIREWKGAR